MTKLYVGNLPCEDFGGRLLKINEAQDRPREGGAFQRRR
jgi:hypothetical protein